MEIIFNELSAYETYPTLFDARGGMNRLIQVIRGVIRQGAQRTLRTTRNFASQNLAPDYSFANWMNDSSVDLEARRFVKTVAAKAPFLEDYYSREEGRREELVEFLFDGQSSLGLGMAFLLDTAAVSLDGDNRFTTDPVLVQLNSLIEGEDAAIDERVVHVCCLSTIEHVHQRRTWITERIQREVRSGMELWKRRESILGNLVFCVQVRHQLENLTGNEPYFRQILRHLFELHRYLGEWDIGPFTLAGISWSEESRETLEHPEYGPLRKLECPDGIERTFSLHSKPTGGNIRIYFFPIQERQIAYIGYIGTHLPTVRHRT